MIFEVCWVHDLTYFFLPSLLKWFGFYKSGQAKETIPLQETTLYTEVTEGEICLGRLKLFLSALVPGAAVLSVDPCLVCPGALSAI